MIFQYVHTHELTIKNTTKGSLCPFPIHMPFPDNNHYSDFY